MTDATPELQFLTSESEGWQGIDADHKDDFDAFFTQVFTSRYLAVLSGLGTSRCIKSAGGEVLAPTMADLWAAVKSANENRFDKVLKQVNWKSNGENVELLLSHCQMQQELRPDDELATFIEKGEEAIAAACNFIHDDSDLGIHESFLRKVARRSTRLPRTQIFTTNYDLAFEMAAAKIGFAVIDGFTASSPARFDATAFDRDQARREASEAAAPLDWVPNVVQVHKLHGSIDWTDSDGAVHRGRPSTRPIIVYPRASKFEVSYQQPFLELMSRFQSSLRRSGTGLLIAGSGFEDRHIAEPVMAAVRGNVGIRIVVIARSLKDKDEGIIGALKKLIKEGDRRIALVAGSFENVVMSLPDLVAPMEEEVHAKRVQSIGNG